MKKKIIVGILLATMAFSLTACSKTQECFYCGEEKECEYFENAAKEKVYYCSDCKEVAKSLIEMSQQATQ